MDRYSPLNDYLLKEMLNSRYRNDTENLMCLINIFLDHMIHRLSYECWDGMPITYNGHPVRTFREFIKFYNDLNLSDQCKFKLLNKFELVRSIFSQDDMLSEDMVELLFH
jgi:hypothetical protein